jgi:hypothetical protein
MSVPKKTELFIYVVIWGGLIVAWNFGYPGAAPILDVIAAVVILFITRWSLKYMLIRDRQKSKIS